MFYFWTTIIAACSNRAVPWADFCDNEWSHKPSCIVPLSSVVDRTEELNLPVVEFVRAESASSGRIPISSASQQYFDRVVLMRYDKGGVISHSINNMGTVNWELLGCLAGTWVVIFLSLVKVSDSPGYGQGYLFPI